MNDPLTRPTPDSNKKTIFIVGTILIVVILTIITIAVLLSKKDPVVLTESENTEVTNVTECDVTIGENFESKVFDVNFSFPCSFQKANEFEYDTSTCEGEVNSSIISFSNSKLNISANDCDISKPTSNINEHYFLTTKDGKTLSVYIFTDPFNSPDLKYFRVMGDRLQMSASSVPTADVVQFKIDLEFIIESLEYNLSI